MDYRPTRTENNKCRRFNDQSWLMQSRAGLSNHSTGSTPELRWLRKECGPARPAIPSTAARHALKRFGTGPKEFPQALQGARRYHAPPPPPHQPRRPRGVRVNHDIRGPGIHRTEVSPKRSVPGWLADSASLNQGEGQKLKS